MTDLEDVLSKLYRFKESIQNQLKFINSLIKLFGSWDAAYDNGAEGLEHVIERINDVMMK